MAFTPLPKEPSRERTLASKTCVTTVPSCPIHVPPWVKIKNHIPLGAITTLVEVSLLDFSYPCPKPGGKLELFHPSEQLINGYLIRIDCYILALGRATLDALC